jgi:hypothetical protein
MAVIGSRGEVTKVVAQAKDPNAAKAKETNHDHDDLVGSRHTKR